MFNFFAKIGQCNKKGLTRGLSELKTAGVSTKFETETLTKMIGLKFLKLAVLVISSLHERNIGPLSFTH